MTDYSRVGEFWQQQKNFDLGARVIVPNRERGFVTEWDMVTPNKGLISIVGTFTVTMDDGTVREFNEHGWRHSRREFSNRLSYNRANFESAYKIYCELF